MRGIVITTLATAASAAPLAARQAGLNLDESVAGLKLDEGLGGQAATLLGAKDGGSLGTALAPLLVGLLGAGVSAPSTRDVNDKATLAARQAGLNLDDSVAGLKLDEGLGGQVATLLGSKDGGSLGTALAPLLTGLLGQGASVPGTRDVDTTLVVRQADDSSLAGLELDEGLGGQVATLLGSKDGGSLGIALAPLLTGLLGQGASVPGTRDVDKTLVARQADDSSLAGLELDEGLGGQVATLLGSKDGGSLGIALAPLLTGLLGQGASVPGTRDVDETLVVRQDGDSLAGLNLDQSLGGQVATLLGAKDGGSLGTALAPLLTGLLGTSTAPPS